MARRADINRPSTIDRLPAEIRAAINQLRERGRTLDEILTHLHSLDVDVSRSALGRHVKGMAKLGERMRRSRVMAEALIREHGDAPESQTARVNIEILHTYICELMELAEGEGEEAERALATLRNPKAIALLSEATERLAKASRHNVEFIEKVEQRSAAKAKREAAAAVEQEARKRGLSAETAEAFKQAVFGLVA